MRGSRYRLPRLSSLLELRLERRRFTRRLLARVGRFAHCRITRLPRRCVRRATRLLLCRSRHLELPLSLRRLARSGRSLQLAHLALCRELTVALVGTEACGQIAHPIVSTAHLILPLFASPLLLLRPLPRQHAPLCLLVPLAPFRSFLSSPRLLIARVRLNPTVHCRPLFRHPRAPLSADGGAAPDVAGGGAFSGRRDWCVSISASTLRRRSAAAGCTPPSGAEAAIPAISARIRLCRCSSAAAATAIASAGCRRWRWRCASISAWIRR